MSTEVGKNNWFVGPVIRPQGKAAYRWLYKSDEREPSAEIYHHGQEIIDALNAQPLPEISDKDV